jgi:hypothetical protein
MEKDKFWLTIIKWVLSFLLALVIIITVHFQASEKRILDAIRSGSDPMSARCALKGDITNLCVIQVSKEKPNASEK